MEHEKQTQKMSIYFPLALLARVRQSAKANRRSFNQEVLSLIEKSLNGKEKPDATSV